MAACPGPMPMTHRVLGVAVMLTLAAGAISGCGPSEEEVRADRLASSSEPPPVASKTSRRRVPPTSSPRRGLPSVVPAATSNVRSRRATTRRWSRPAWSERRPWPMASLPQRRSGLARCRPARAPRWRIGPGREMSAGADWFRLRWAQRGDQGRAQRRRSHRKATGRSGHEAGHQPAAGL